ncbi:Protein of unknown function [Azospirillum lipoferum 4B]|uniref:Uncharacterized protein n=1 Tax=Azospirillum lipoferum (strain 4B) TaxID=862719 RepID=G7Z6D6_AZOL4|nr:Protein of unknown function [Azospirillum lipoferum 4B]
MPEAGATFGGVVRSPHGLERPPKGGKGAVRGAIPSLVFLLRPFCPDGKPLGGLTA